MSLVADQGDVIRIDYDQILDAYSGDQFAAALNDAVVGIHCGDIAAQHIALSVRLADAPHGQPGAHIVPAEVAGQDEDVRSLLHNLHMIRR